MNIPYRYGRQALAEVDIEDLGNCNIVAYNDNADEFYLRIVSTDGYAQIVECGPVSTDIEPKYVCCIYRKMEFKEKKIIHLIDDFLNAPQKQINQVVLVSEEEMDNALLNVAERMCLCEEKKK